MSASSLPRQQQRRLKRLCADVDRLIETDRRFFRRRPDRAHRVRRSFPAEIDVAAILGIVENPLPDGQVWFTAVRQILPGFRHRYFFFSGSEHEPDLFPEEVCCRLFEEVVDACAAARAQSLEVPAALNAGGRF
jgi:hypothetical protein